MQRKQMKLVLLLCALVCLLTLAVSAAGTKADDGWYELSSADDIADLAAEIAGGKTGVRDQKYRLTCDIDMSKLSDETSFNEELTSLEALYREVTGLDMEKYYRPPQGIYSEKNLEMAQKLGYRTVFWSLAYVDWYQNDQPTDEQAYDKLLPRIHPGAVVLLHSTSQTNARILDDLLTKWEDMGYSFCTLDELYA